MRKLLDHGLVTADDYGRMAADWNKDYLRSKKSRKGGNYYLTRLAYVGEGFARLVFESHHQGRLSKSEMATHLNMKARNIDKLGGYLGW